MASIGRPRTRRPSLIWTETINRYQSMDFDDRRFDSMLPHELNFIFVQFEDREEENVERVAVIPGKTLRDVIEGRLKQRGLGFDQVEFFLEKSSTPIPCNSDVGCLVGQKIIVRGKGMRMGRHTRSTHSMDDADAGRPSRKISADAVMRKASFANAKAKHRQQSESRGSNGGSEDLDSSRSRENLQREGSSFGDEPSCSDGGSVGDVDSGGSRRAKSTTGTRISLFFGKKMEMMNALKALKETSASRVPEMLHIEEHWHTIVRQHDQLPLRAKHQQEAIWEIVMTEKNYIEHLRHMEDLQRYLQELRKRGFLQEVDAYKVFCNYSSLYECNMYFWEKAVLPMLTKSRATGCPLDPLELWPGFENINGWCEYYVRLHVEHDRTYLQRLVKDNELFKHFVEWAESQDVMKRLKFVETLTTYPMQHMTRYGLLLQAILKHSTDADERVSLQRMIDEANAATHRLNIELDNKDLRAKLNTLMMCIDGCEYLDSDDSERIWGNRSVVNLVAPMPFLSLMQYRRVLLRGEVKVKEGRTAPKMDMTCFVFTDLFLMCRPSKKGADRLRIARPPMHIARVQVFTAEPANGFYFMYMNEFGPSAIFLLTTPTVDDTKRWLEMIKIAQEEYFSLVQTDEARRGSSTRLFLDGSGQCVMGATPPGMPPMLMPLHPPLPPPPPAAFQALIAHRKSSSMDSQAVAAQHELRKNTVLCSTEQLDRGYDRLPPRSVHKLSVASCVAAPISSSKSSIDLHFAVQLPTDPAGSHARSRSNSSGPEIVDCHAQYSQEGMRRSRSPSPTRKQHVVELNGRGTPAGRNSPLVTTSGRGTPLESLRCNDSLRGTPRSESPATASPDADSVSHSPALMVTTTEEEREQAGTPNGNRRFEKRYHTSDGIDITKKAANSLPTGILKRFSWNVSSAVGGTRGKINSRLNEQTRRSSQSSTAASSDSFASSTSGISSSSSHMEATIDEEKLSGSSHVSNISVNEPSTASTLSISLEQDEKGEGEKNAEQSNGQSPPISITSTSSAGSSPPPPLPDRPPPGPTKDCSSQAALHNQKAELIKFIMDNHLETSDV